MKLFLTSVALSPALRQPFRDLVGKSPADTRVALIENAADVYEGEPAWVRDNRESLEDAGLKVSRIDLKNLSDPHELESALEPCDVIWLGGGNTYYLRWLLKTNAADKVIRKLITSGKVYAGGSAGAIMAGPTLKHFETADDPRGAPVVYLDGLGLTDTVVVPHSDNVKYAAVIGAINEALLRDGFSTCPLRDDQALLLDGTTHRLLP